jgi:hypothetical protein
MISGSAADPGTAMTPRGFDYSLSCVLVLVWSPGLNFDDD